MLAADLVRVAKAAVVSSAVRAPLRSMIALVTSVVPWMTCSHLGGRCRVARCSASRQHVGDRLDGSPGVVSTLPTVSSPVCVVDQDQVGERAADVDAGPIAAIAGITHAEAVAAPPRYRRTTSGFCGPMLGSSISSILGLIKVRGRS